MRSLPPNIHEQHSAAVTPPPVALLQPAWSVLPLIRSPLGYDFVYPAKAIFMALMLAIGGFLIAAFYPPARDGAVGFFTFVALSFAASLAAFFKRARGQRKGEEVHTQEAGYSFVTRQWPFLPPALCEQLLTPALLGLVGCFLAIVPLAWDDGTTAPLSPMLGWWLMLSALSYLLMARWEYRMKWAQTREPVNQMIRAKLFEARLDTHERAARKPAPSRAHRSGANRAAVDGSEPDIAELGGTPHRPWFTRGRS
jgi:hypothetical protein